MRLGIADHFGWAIAVTATDDFEVVDRRRIALVEADVTPAPIHYDGKNITDVAVMTKLIAKVRASIDRATTQAFDALPSPITSISLRVWPDDFPTDVATQMRVPYEARADAVMYRQVVAEVAQARGWAVHVYEAKAVEAQAAALLGARAADVLDGPRKRLGAPWAKDHRVALAATVVAGS